MAGKVERVLNELILEHARTNEAVGNLGLAISDATAQELIQKTGRSLPSEQTLGKQAFQKIAHSLELFNLSLRAHFFREETLLMEAFRESGSEALVAALNELMEEHNHMRERLEETMKEVEVLSGENISKFLWQTKAEELKIHLKQTESILAIHAEREEALFKVLRDF